MPPGAFSGTQAQAAREVNTASLCRIGQETVQDIVFRTMEIFQLLRNMQVRKLLFLFNFNLVIISSLLVFLLLSDYKHTEIACDI